MKLVYSLAIVLLLGLPSALRAESESPGRIPSLDESRAELVRNPASPSAHATLARTLHRLARMTAPSDEKTTYAREAREYFQEAERLGASQWGFYNDWALLLGGQTECFATTPEKTSTVLSEAIGLFDKSLAGATYSAQLAELRRDRSVCLMKLAEISTDSKNRLQLYHEADTGFDYANARVPKAMTARYHGLWGVALLRIAELKRETMTARQAVARLLTALEIDPRNAEVHYNLACAYSLNRQTTNALTHLRMCFEYAADERFRLSASTDVDLEILRESDDFKLLLTDATQSEVARRLPTLSNW